MSPKSRNEALFARAQLCIPAGVNSPVRAFRAVGGTPPFLERALGAYLWDADGKRYIDYVGSWGPMLAGHTDARVVKAVQDAAARGLSFGAPTEAEIALAETLCRLVPSIELLRLVSSGTEATMTALRLARGATGRSVIVNMSSGWGRSVSPMVGPYCTSKWAIEGFSRALAADLPRPLASVAVNPGIIDTAMLRSCFGDAAGQYPDPEGWAVTAATIIGLGAGIVVKIRKLMG